MSSLTSFFFFSTRPQSLLWGVGEWGNAELMLLVLEKRSVRTLGHVVPTRVQLSDELSENG